MKARLHHGRGARKPFSRWSVIPHGWDDQHRAVVDATMTARIAVYHPTRPGAAGTWNPATEQNELATPTPFLEAWARIVRTNGRGTSAPIAEDPEPVASYQVTTGADDPAADQIQTGDILRVTNSGDPAADATGLLVEHVVVGSLRFSRVLICSLNPHQTA